MGLTSLQVGLLAVFSISICLATCGIVVRFWARILLRKRWEANDYVMLVSYLAVLALVIAAFIGVLNAHVGVHVVDIPATEREEALGLNYKLVFIDTVLFATASTFANISISHFYTTIFPHLWLVRTCHVQMVLVALFWVSSVVASCLICQPLAFLWDRHLPGGGKCFDIRHFWLGGSIVSLCFDTVNVVMPMPILWRLRMDWRKKVRLTVLFGLGAVVLAVTATRIYYDLRVDLSDVTYTAAPILLFSVPEPCLGIFAGCLPIMSPVFTRASRRLRTSLVKDPTAAGAGVNPDAQRSKKNGVGRRALTGSAESKAGFQKLGPWREMEMRGMGTGGMARRDGDGERDVERGVPAATGASEIGTWDRATGSGEHGLDRLGDQALREMESWDRDRDRDRHGRRIQVDQQVRIEVERTR